MVGNGKVEPHNKDIAIVIREALDKHQAGKIGRGHLDLATNKRDLLDEAEQEILDCINYCVFQILRLRRMQRL
ncbi:MAG TPA: hypothetical protein DCP92_23900 [Nitrospiraceae bacterium]|jgi:hypothetical protein|nr:hypothetical protein [Nitrospiraceae bacterium]